jgi:hypothetical protein
MENTKYNRRNFLEQGVNVTAGVAIGLVAGKALKSVAEDAPEYVKMLTPDGRLVMVDKRHLPPMCAKPVPVSNQTLLAWMEEGKK